MTSIKVRKLDPAAVVPTYAMAGDAGADLSSIEDIRLAPGERRLVRTGLALEIPHGHAGFVHPRSGLAARVGLSMVNAPGTIDAGYRGEILVNLINLDPTDLIVIHRGDRIAQLVVQQVASCTFTEVDELSASSRDTQGHGSTGGAKALTGESRSGSEQSNERAIAAGAQHDV